MAAPSDVEGNKSGHGGARPGVGRKRKADSEKVQQVNVTLSSEEAALIDALRGTIPRSTYVRSLLRKTLADLKK